MRRAHFPLWILAATLAGCGDLQSPLGPDPVADPSLQFGPGERRAAPVALGPEQVVVAYARALAGRNLAAYADVLAPDFEYCVRDVDIVDFPWMTGECWSRRDELRMIENMSNPDFLGSESPVESIDMQFAILSQRELSPTLVVVTIDATITVLVSPDTGWLTQTRFEFEVLRDRGGLHRIQRMREFSPLREEVSWAEIKSLYR